jgi:hypothetical protein
VETFLFLGSGGVGYNSQHHAAWYMVTNISEELAVSNFTSIPKMETTGLFEMFVYIYQTTQHRIPADCDLNICVHLLHTFQMHT